MEILESTEQVYTSLRFYTGDVIYFRHNYVGRQCVTLKCVTGTCNCERTVFDQRMYQRKKLSRQVGYF